MIARLDQRNAKSSFEAAQARFEIAKKEFGRSRVLMERGIIPQAEFDSSKTNFDIAAAEMRIRKKGMDDTVLKAPFDGIVSKRYVENYQRIKAKDAIKSLKNISPIDVVIQVPERLIAHGGGERFSKARVRFDALPSKYFAAEIREFSIESDPITRTYNVVVSLEPPDGLQILPGMTATVIAPLTAPGPASDTPPGIVIPLAAVVGGSDSTAHVWVIPSAGGSPVKTTVELGTLRKDGIKILAGLEPGAQVAVAGVHRLTESMQVRPARQNREGLDQ